MKRKVINRVQMRKVRKILSLLYNIKVTYLVPYPYNNFQHSVVDLIGTGYYNYKYIRFYLSYIPNSKNPITPVKVTPVKFY